MKADDLKQYIINNPEYIEKILEDLGFHKIKNKDNADYITCALPNYNNSNGFSVLKENLFCNSFSVHMSFKGYLFDLVMEMKGFTFGQCMRYIHGLLGLKYEFSKDKEDDKPKDSILDFFKKYDKKHKNNKLKELKTYTKEEIEKLYTKCPYIEWVRQGIIPSIQEEFGIGYHYESKRVVFPHRKWDTGEIVGLIGRTLKSEAEIELFDIPKYFPIIKYTKSQNLYGLYENMKYIKEKGEVIVLEAEKSVWQMASKGIRNCVSVCCHDLSEEQIKILVGLDVDIVIAYDKDVPLEYVKSQCKEFNGMRNLYYIYDEINLLKDKESIADKHLKIINVMMNRFKFKYEG